MNILSKSSEETHKIGVGIGKSLKKGSVLALEGDLGGGKTTLVKGIGEGLGIKEKITSPSFSLEKIYLTSPEKASLDRSKKAKDQRLATLYHFDFYRIDNPKDMMNYELLEALDDPEGVVVVEWAEKIEKELPKERLVIKFHYKDENEREIELDAEGEKYKKLIKNL